MLVCAVKVGGQPGGYGLLREGRRTGHPEPYGGPERREGGRTSLEGEDRGVNEWMEGDGGCRVRLGCRAGREGRGGALKRSDRGSNHV